VLIICLAKIALADNTGHSDPGTGNQTTSTAPRTYLIDPDITILTFCQAMANVLYAYAGHWMYFEIMAEMQEPQDFYKVFYINAPLQLGMYMTVALVGYYYLGADGKHYLIENMEEGSTWRFIVQVLLFAHIAIVYLIKNIALSRFLVKLIRPEAVESETSASKLLFAGCPAGILVAGWVVANSMPVFYDLVGLIGAVLCGPISFVLPVIFFVFSMAISWAASQAKGKTSTMMLDSVVPVSTEDTEDGEIDENPMNEECIEDGDRTEEHETDNGDVWAFVRNHLHVGHTVQMLGIVLFIVLIMITGSFSAISDIAKKAEAGEISIFSCT
jgi:hypothetical protein